MTRFHQTILPVLIAAAGMAALALVLRAGWTPLSQTPLRVATPQADGSALQSRPESVAAGVLTLGPGTAGLAAGDWPGFRGGALDAVASASFATDWSTQAPRVLWTVEVGEGYAGAAVRNGRLYVMDYDTTAQADALRCLSLDDGREIWRYAYGVKVKRNHGMSRTVPAVSEQHVVAMGPKCHVTSLDAVSGALAWQIDLVAKYGATVPQWYAGQCPLIEDGRAILAPGGPGALMVAIDCASGRELWRTPNPHGWRMTHASILPIEMAGRRMYIYCASGGVVAVSADDGSILWETQEWKIANATVPTPVDCGAGRVFFSGGYGAGSVMMQLACDGPAVTHQVLYRLEPKGFGSEQQTPVFYQGHLYGVLPRDVGSLSERLVCLDLSGVQAWSSGGDKFGLGPYMVAGESLLVLDDDGTLSAVRATNDGYQLQGRVKLLSGRECWGPMALAGNRLIVRDLTRMMCVELP